MCTRLYSPETQTPIPPFYPFLTYVDETCEEWIWATVPNGNLLHDCNFKVLQDIAEDLCGVCLVSTLFQGRDGARMNWRVYIESQLMLCLGSLITGCGSTVGNLLMTVSVSRMKIWHLSRYPHTHLGQATQAGADHMLLAVAHASQSSVSLVGSVP